MNTVLLKDKTQFESWVIKTFAPHDLLTDDELDSFLAEIAPSEYPCLAYIKYSDDIFRHGVTDFIYKSQIDVWAESMR